MMYKSYWTPWPLHTDLWLLNLVHHVYHLILCQQCHAFLSLICSVFCRRYRRVWRAVWSWIVPVLCVRLLVAGSGLWDVRTVTVVSYTMFCSCTMSVIVTITVCTTRTATCIIDDQMTITLQTGLWRCCIAGSQFFIINNRWLKL